MYNQISDLTLTPISIVIVLIYITFFHSWTMTVCLLYWTNISWYLSHSISPSFSYSNAHDDDEVAASDVVVVVVVVAISPFAINDPEEQPWERLNSNGKLNFYMVQLNFSISLKIKDEREGGPGRENGKFFLHFSLHHEHHDHYIIICDYYVTQQKPQ